MLLKSSFGLKVHFAVTLIILLKCGILRQVNFMIPPIEPWQRTRAKGMARYLLWTTIWWGGCMITGTTLMDYFFDGSVLITTRRVIVWLILGFVYALFGWFINELNYKYPSKANPDTGSREMNQASNDEV